jgi:hypothetical protein
MDDQITPGDDAPFNGRPRDTADRRNFLKKAGIGAAAAWTAPILLSTSAAHAQGTVPAIEFVDAATASVSGGGTIQGPSPTLVVNNPPGVQNGDLLLAIVTSNPNSTLTAAGWTQLATVDSTALTNNVRTFLLHRTATGGGGTFSFTRAFSGFVADGGVFRGAIVAYRNVASLGPNATGVSTSLTATHTFPSVTTTGANDQWIVRLGGLGSVTRDWNAPPGTSNSRVDTGNNNRTIAVFDSIQASPGSTGTQALGNSGGTTRAGMHTIALVPA